MKVTYVTMAGNEEAHAAYESGLQAVRARLGDTHSNFIGGVPAPWTGPVFEDRSPTDPSILVGRFPLAGAEMVARALEAARAAYPAWSGMPWKERLGMLRAAAERISADSAQLAALMSIEVGKNRLEAFGDAEESADLIRYYCDQVEQAGGFVKPLGKLLPGEETCSVLRPFGVWGVISPFNFPMALPAGMAGGALGVTFLEAGFDGLVFTGSKKVGLDLMGRFWREYPKPVIVEMGGKNPAVVTARADLAKAASGVARSAFGYGGQKCSACSRAYVEAPVYDEFLEALVSTARGLKVGDPALRGTYMGPLITASAVATYRRAVEEARRDGRVLIGGEDAADAIPGGHFVTPAVVDRLPEGHRLLSDELFVPLVCVVKVASLDEAIRKANRTEYGLTAGVFSEDESEVQAFFDRVEAGVLYANRHTGATTGAWPGVQSFCGWKASGSTGKGACGPYYVQQFMREQSRTIVRS